MDYQKELNFYREHLVTSVLPFWRKALDRQNGGVYTCYTNDGYRRVSTDKYTWSQGRFIWIWSRLADLCRKGILTGIPEDYLQQAGKTVDFLQKYAFLDNGNCVFLLTEEGRKKGSLPGRGYDTSFYADCFVVLGFSEYARVSGEKKILDKALQLYDNIETRLRTGNVRSEPYPVPKGLKPHGFSMIMLNVTQELEKTLRFMAHSRQTELLAASKRYMHEIMDEFCRPNGLIAEMLVQDTRLADTVLCRHINPGHTLEDMWFVMSSALVLGEKEMIDKAAWVAELAANIGWDKKYGGLLRFVDKEGGRPKGRVIGNDSYENLILDTWDSKLWWPHSEILYTTLLAYVLTEKQSMLSWYQKARDYVFATFPHADQTVGEWIQIRDRQGRPLNKVVALPVKDPYHIIRNLLLLIALLSQVQEKGKDSLCL
jgi:N-acylglucosamine 2-epimerase